MARKMSLNERISFHEGVNEEYEAFEKDKSDEPILQGVYFLVDGVKVLYLSAKVYMNQ